MVIFFLDLFHPRHFTKSIVQYLKIILCFNSMESLLAYLDINGNMKDLLGTVKLFISNSMTKWPQTTSTVFKVVQKFLSKVCMTFSLYLITNTKYD